MNLTISGHHLEVTPAIREYAMSKISRVTRHFDHVIDITVLLSVEKLQQKAEITCTCAARTFIAKRLTPTCTPRSIAWSTSWTAK